MSLKQILPKILTNNPDRTAVNELVQMSSNMALAYLRLQLHRGALDDYRFGIPTDDLAIDCIADMFLRNEEGRFCALDTYFDSIQWTQLSDTDLQIALRRLVFSKVNEGIFRSYRNEDPNLAKIIRNVKEAIKRSDKLFLKREREMQWIIAGPEGTVKSNKPLAPVELLETYLTPILCTESNTYTAVYAFLDFLSLHTHYCNAYPLSEYARILRSCFKNRHVPVQPTEEMSMASMDVETALDKTISHVRNTLYKTYVQKGKLSLTMYDNYINAVQKALSAQFGFTSDPIESQYEALAAYMPNLSKDAFQEEHRNIMQYVFKVSRKRMIGMLQEGA